MSRSNSRSEGSIGRRWEFRIAAFVWRGVDEGDDERGRGGRSDCRGFGTECMPMYENSSLRGFTEAPSEAEFVSALRKVRIANLFANTGWKSAREDGRGLGLVIVSISLNIEVQPLEMIYLELLLSDIFAKEKYVVF